MKKMKPLILLVLVLSLLCTACKGDVCEHTCPNCGKCTDDACESEKCTCDSQQDALCTLSGLTGEGYSFTAEGYTVTADGKLQAEVGTQLKLALVLGESYCTGDPVVKLDGQTLTAEDSTYTVTLSGDSVLALEGACFYEVIARNPFGLKPEGSVDEVGGPMSEESSIIKAAWTAEGYFFANTKLEPYYSVMFYARAEGCWLSFRDRLGQFNEKDTPIYGNGVKNPESGKMEPDSAWHKYEFVRQTDDQGVISYGLYVDGQKHTHYDEKNQVDARLQDQLNDLLLDLNGTYYVSELFGCADPAYVVEYPDYYIVEQEIFDLEADGLLTDDYPCEESVRYNLYYKPQWSQEKPLNFPMEPYLSAKFYINSPGTGWIICRLGDEELKICEPGSGWHEFLLESNGTDYSLYIDGEDTGKTVQNNLRELTFLLNEATYYVSELFVTDDPDFDGIIDEPYYQEPVKPDQYGTGRLPSGTVSIMDNPFTISGTQSGQPLAGFEASSKLELTWNRYSFNNLDLAPYTSVMFAVKTRGWYGLMVGNNVLTEMEGTGDWRMIRLTRMSGNLWKLYYGATPIQTLSLPNDNLTDLAFRFGTDTFYVTDLRGVKDPNYVPPQYVNVTNGDPLGVGAAPSEDVPNADFVTGSYQFTPAQWTKASFISVDVLAYKDLRFFVKAAGQSDKWLSMNKGDDMLMAANDDTWHEVRLKKAEGALKLYVDGAQKGFISSLAQLTVMFNENATYSYTDIYGVVDEAYAPATVTVTAPAGCTVEFRQYQTGVSSFTVEKGTGLTFELKFNGICQGTPVVKANGTVLTAVNGRYSYNVKGDTAITVEGITVKDPFTVIADNPLNISGQAVTDIPEGYQHVTQLNIPWTANGVAFRIKDLSACSEVKFAIKSEAWHGLGLKGTTIAEHSGKEWKEVRLVRNGSAWDFYYGGELKKTLTLANNNLSDLTFLTGGNDTYYITELRAIVDADYAPATVTVTVPNGCKIEFRQQQAVGDTLQVEKGTTLYFELTFSNSYEGTPVVKANGETLNDVYGLYTYVVKGDTAITVEGVTVHNPYTVIADNPLDLSGQSVTDLAEGYQYATKMNIPWTADGVLFRTQDLKSCSEVKFAIKSEAWHGLGQQGTTIAEHSGKAWMEVRLVRNGNAWDFYYGGVLKKTLTLPNNKLSDLTFLTGGSDIYYMSEVQAIVEQQEQTYEFITGDVLSVSGTAADNTAEGYEQSTKLNIQWTANGASFAVQNLLPYTDVKFAVQSVAWHGIGLNGETLGQHGGGAWIEVRLVKNGSGWDFYYGGELVKTLTLPNNSLSDLTLLTGGNDTYYVSELRGIANPDYKDPYTLVIGNALSVQGEAADNTAQGYENSTKLNIGWTADGVAFASQNLLLYSDVKFVVRSVAWHGIGLNGETLGQHGGGAWMEVRLVRNGSGWDFYYGGALVKTVTLPNNSLSDLTLLTGGNSTYYVSELRGISTSQQPAPESSYSVVADNFINAVPTSTSTGNLPSTDVTKANIFQCGWTSPGVADGISLADYTELKFWYTVTSASKWFELYGPSNSVIYQGNKTAWTELKFVLEGTSWTLYVDEVWTKGGLTGTTLKELLPTLTLGGSVTADVYVTQLIGKKEESTEGPAVPESGYTVVAANLVNTAPSSIVTENLPSEDVSRANVFNCGWTSPGMTDGITLADYTELKFWYKVSDEGKWFEMYDADGGTVYAGNVTAWTEVKFLWEQENQAWTLYVDGQWKKTGMTGTTLKDIVPTLTLGGSVTADVYVTDLVGK